jgi:ribosome-associated heat shock protein Hsp15
VVRSRSDAAALVEAGHARLNGQRITQASQPLRRGDVVTLALDRTVRVLAVQGFSERRGGPAAGRALYRDLTTSSGAKACAFAGAWRMVSR